MADSNRAVARPNRLLQSYRRQSKTSIRDKKIADVLLWLLSWIDQNRINTDQKIADK
jgi:hypothetical protein